MNLIGLIKERARYYRCLSCSKALAGCDVALLSQSDAHCTVKVTCAHCQASFVAVLLFRRRPHPEGLPQTAQDPISGDEMLELHELLEDFQGPLPDLVKS